MKRFVFGLILVLAFLLMVSLVVSAVAVGWSGYVGGFLAGIGFPLPALAGERPLCRRADQPAGHDHHRAGGGHAVGGHA